MAHTHQLLEGCAHDVDVALFQELKLEHALVAAVAFTFLDDKHDDGSVDWLVGWGERVVAAHSSACGVATLLWRVIQLVSLCNAGSKLAASIIERHLILKVVAFGSLDAPSQAQRSRAFAAKASHQEPAAARGGAGCGAQGCYQHHAYDFGVVLLWFLLLV